VSDAEPADRERLHRRRAISVLRARLQATEATWHRDSGVDRERVERLETRMEGRRRRIASLHYEITAARRRLEELEAEERRAAAELAGYERGLEALLSEAISRVERIAEPSWTPVPVVGYRMWTIQRLRLRGARAVWETAEYRATCRLAAAGRTEGVPHSDGRCGRLGCGVYALKEAAMLVGAARSAAARPGVVLGAVALTGKVVEHDSGYRARYARAIAAGALWRNRMVVSCDPAWIDRLFADPVVTLDGPCPGLAEEIGARPRRLLVGAIAERLDEMGRRFQDRYTTQEQ
jgi:hypothetical protein